MKNKKFLLIFLLCAGLSQASELSDGDRKSVQAEQQSDGDKKTAVAELTEQDQKKVKAAFHVLFDAANPTGGTGIQNRLALMTLGMLDEWDEKPRVVGEKVEHAKFFTNAGIAYSTEGSVEFFDCNGTIRKTVNAHAPWSRFTLIDADPDPRIAIWSDQLQIRNINTGEIIHSEHPLNPWKSVQFTKDGKQLMTGCTDSTQASLQLFDLETRQLQATFHDKGYLRVARVSDDGIYIASGTHEAGSEAGHRIRIFDIRIPKVAAREMVATSDISDMRFIAGSDELVVSESFAEGSINTWDIATGIKKRTIAQSACHIAIDENANRLVSCGNIGRYPSNYVRIWNLKTSALIAKINTGEYMPSFECCDMSPDGKSILAVPTALAPRVLLWTQKPLKAQLGELQAQRVVQSRRTLGNGAAESSSNLGSAGSKSAD